MKRIFRLVLPWLLLSHAAWAQYLIQDSILLRTPDGATLSVMVVRKKDVKEPLPAVLYFTIYSNPARYLKEAKLVAERGYVSVTAEARGKRLSPDAVAPYEHEARDVNVVIDWISKQRWCNGSVGMYGGSYTGFAQWAATKHLHPALKTIVPYVAAIPGQGLPMENNVFLNANYQWAFYVTHNKYLDTAVNNDWQRWQRMRNTWFATGAAYRSIDSIDGEPNPLLQRWLQHPAYDAYWQAMVPYKEDFARINIPVLTIEGYYDDGQISGLRYMREHLKYNKHAVHYLIIGPYDHFSTQTGGKAVLRDYTVDTVALIDTREITFQWLDYILRGGLKPAILKDKVNYEVMGANKWRHAPSLEEMSDTTLTFYLSDNHQLVNKKPVRRESLLQTVDLADRGSFNNDYYPDPIIRKQLRRQTGLYYISEPFDAPVTVNGAFYGKLRSVINKKDMHIGVTLYEVTPDGQYFELSYFLGCASYAKDPTHRQLLQPGRVEDIPFTETRLVSRQLSKGSRLLVMLDVDKNPFAEINYGTGKDVSRETIADAGAPLQIHWQNDSYICVPIAR
ncbi:CocE/NonD family hydrolase [Chitinophaga ginsengisoli]|uniref:Xaa-Pro dipeptidyl-peptidase C-terminal domain-containing protein n=1 Tax=Chitinophaga ginsengisoli TaxID=363837 RepID=A0A2P8G568_9BACT|nr:CocE/NonD family hydrolase [Chitinophaga ginsengisoli]PSL29035.1 hypothetical protein CLV42_107181 [Chitinophaga ginsengisoli]